MKEWVCIRCGLLHDSTNSILAKCRDINCKAKKPTEEQIEKMKCKNCGSVPCVCRDGMENLYIQVKEYQEKMKLLMSIQQGIQEEEEEEEET